MVLCFLLLDEFGVKFFVFEFIFFVVINTILILPWKCLKLLVFLSNHSSYLFLVHIHCLFIQLDIIPLYLRYQIFQIGIHLIDFVHFHTQLFNLLRLFSEIPDQILLISFLAHKVRLSSRKCLICSLLLLQNCI